MNLTHRASHDAPEPLVPGERYEVRVELDATSWVFEPGHHIRLAIAGADWPNAWPPPEASELTIDRAGTRLLLPTVAGPPPITEEPNLTPSHADVSGGPDDVATWRIEHDVYGRETRVVVDQRTVDRVDGCTVSAVEGGEVGVLPASPGTAWVVSETDYTLSWPEVTARAHARLQLRSDPTTYTFTLELDVYEDGAPIRSRRWERTAPRHLQ